jgi:hypothetical protein
MWTAICHHLPSTCNRFVVSSLRRREDRPYYATYAIETSGNDGGTTELVSIFPYITRRWVLRVHICDLRKFPRAFVRSNLPRGFLEANSQRAFGFHAMGPIKKTRPALNGREWHPGPLVEGEVLLEHCHHLSGGVESFLLHAVLGGLHYRECDIV